VCRPDYYINAVRFLTRSHPRLRLFVFSDEPDWAEENLHFDAPTHIVREGNHAYEDLWLMSQCKHNIIANSTFSWWAGWLNQNPAKQVVCPSKWFLDGRTTTALLPPEWHQEES